MITKAAYFHAAPDMRLQLPRPLCIPDTPELLSNTRWDLLSLNRTGCRSLLSRRIPCACSTLLLPGDTAVPITQLIQAGQVISAGLSSRNSITFSSIQKDHALICVQRTLIRTDGSALEPQEFLQPLSSPPDEEQLLLFALRLLMPTQLP